MYYVYVVYIHIYLIELFGLKEAYRGPQCIGTCVNNRGSIEFGTSNTTNYFNSIPPTCHSPSPDVAERAGKRRDGCPKHDLLQYCARPGQFHTVQMTCALGIRRRRQKQGLLGDEETSRRLLCRRSELCS